MRAGVTSKGILLTGRGFTARYSSGGFVCPNRNVVVAKKAAYTTSRLGTITRACQTSQKPVNQNSSNFSFSTLATLDALPSIEVCSGIPMSIHPPIGIFIDPEDDGWHLFGREYGIGLSPLQRRHFEVFSFIGDRADKSTLFVMAGAKVGNGGQTIQKGDWAALIRFLNSLHADHLVLELAHRPASDLEALKELDARIGVGLGVVDIKVNHIETPEEIARAIERAEKVLGEGRVRYVHPDCGFWMLKRSVADRKIAALAQGRDLRLGRK
jgi:hypothetical protein